MSDSTAAVSQARLAQLAGVARAAVTQWRNRHADFPAPIDAGGDLRLADVITWLDTRPVPANRREPDEAAGVTYGGRVRRQLRAAEEPARDRVKELGALSTEFGGRVFWAEYLYLLLCLTFLRLYDHDRWSQLMHSVPPNGDPIMAQRLLRRVVALADESLAAPDVLRASDAPPSRLRPRAFEPIRKVIALVAGLGPADFARLRAAYLRQVSISGEVISTPEGVARTMVALLAGTPVDRGVLIYDPFARFGELPAEFIRAAGDLAAAAGDTPDTVLVRAEHPDAGELRLAGMWLMASGTPAELAVTPAPTPAGATFVLTNPPFGKHVEDKWLRHCVDSLTEEGRAVVLMPYSAGFAGKATMRRELVDQGALIAVVALPARMFSNTRVGVCIWLLRRPTRRPAAVRFVDARHRGRARGLHVELDATDVASIVAAVTAENQPEFSVLATHEYIQARGYSLHPPEYQDGMFTRSLADVARAELEALSTDVELPSYTTGGGWSGRPLNELCHVRNGVSHRSLTAAVARAGTAGVIVPVVHPRHLRSGIIEAVDAPMADAASLEQYRLRTGDVLWVRTGAMGQAALVGEPESGWLPHTNLLRLCVIDPEVLDPAYLLAFLLEPAVLARIRERSIRSVTTSISKGVLGELVMPLPPLAAQREILAAVTALDDHAASLQRRLNAVRAARSVLGQHLIDGTVVLTGRQTL
ncbi:N-6 DNA methylase [Micromonospora sp. NPDC047762]|uniref:N-6 DNA methylase n=1 Tax=Micromonospora sp. NPDC047762 TaxID=3364255 RepID=UPI003718243B